MLEEQGCDAGQAEAPGHSAAVRIVKERPNQQEKGERAFRAYLDLTEAADTLRYRVRGQLEIFGLTVRGFQIMEILHAHGAMRATEVAERCRCERQNIDRVVRQLQEEGWVTSEIATLPPSELRPSKLARMKRDAPRKGHRIAILRITEAGKKFMGAMLVRHKKVIKAFFRALDGREQQTLSGLCRRLTLGDPLKFISEMEFEDVEEGDCGAAL